MLTITRIYFDVLNNLFSFLFLFTLIKQNIRIKPSKKKLAILIFIEILYAIPESIPYGTLLGSFIGMLCIFSLCYPNLKKMPLIYLKYELFTNLFMAFIILFQSLLLWDFSMFFNNEYYQMCKNLICSSLLYIFYTLYINTKQLKQYPSKQYHLFNTIIVLISIVLSYLTLYICKLDLTNSPIVPVFFSIIYLLIAACISVYSKFINLMKENALSHIQLEKYKLEQQYSMQIDQSIKTLRSLRHDMKNHLIIISGYAAQNNCEKIKDYVNQITDHFSQTYIIDTPSSAVSALLNTKYQETEQKKMKCNFNCDFTFLQIEDYDIITILGNLLDNAITAASKCNDGILSLSIKQLDSFLQIQIENTHKETILESNGIFQTTKKEDSEFHGIGIKNVRSIVTKLNGQIDISYTTDRFFVSITVPNYKTY